jgi:hypothetical protein
MTAPYRFTITVERPDRLKIEQRTMPRPPQEWTADDVQEVIAMLTELAGRQDSKPGAPAQAEVQFLSKGAGRGSFKVVGPTGTATTDPLPITADQLVAAGFSPPPSNASQS